MAFLVRVLINGVAIWFATLILPGLSIVGGDSNWETLAIILLIALVFGLVNAIVKPIVAFISIPLYILTLGLFTIIVNALMLMLTAWITEATGLGSADRQLRCRVLGRHHHLDRQPGPLGPHPRPPRARARRPPRSATRPDRRHLRRDEAGSRVTWNWRVTAVVPSGPSTSWAAASNARMPGLPASSRSASTGGLDVAAHLVRLDEGRVRRPAAGRQVPGDHRDVRAGLVRHAVQLRDDVLRRAGSGAPAPPTAPARGCPAHRPSRRLAPSTPRRRPQRPTWRPSRPGCGRPA